MFDTLAGEKRDFVPQIEGHAGVYVCGPTVYDMAHIGHARAYVAFDTIVRFLRRHFKVTYVRNFTDVDDKIIRRAAELGENPTAVSERFIVAFREDMARLGVLPADVEPKVTEHIDEIIAITKTLVDAGFAYMSNGDVYYAVDRFAEYGKLAKRKRDDMDAGVRVEVSEIKRNPLDFALWKGAKEGEPFWDSPWGPGRPGWHIECSAMSRTYLGETFDIHAGGKDLIFPHHENEIAQSEAAHGKPFARYWLHNGFVNIDNEKMSKSLGNFFTIRDVLKRFDPLTLRLYLLSTHYRSPISFSDAGLQEAQNRLRYLMQTMARLEASVTEGSIEGSMRAPWVSEMVDRFESAMADDFNTPRVLGDLSEAFKLINETIDQPGDRDVDARTLRVVFSHLKNIGSSIGLFEELSADVLARLDTLEVSVAGIDPKVVDELVAARIKARAEKDFVRADEIRASIESMGVMIKDAGNTTTWEIKKTLPLE